MKKITSILAATAFVVALSSCTSKPAEEATQATTEVAPAADMTGSTETAADMTGSTETAPQ